jgi:hypothetical protein
MLKYHRYCKGKSILGSRCPQIRRFVWHVGLYSHFLASTCVSHPPSLFLRCSPILPSSLKHEMAVRTSDAVTTHCWVAAVSSEILQIVFRNLSLFDLIRCQRVCTTWTACLPGNDPRLREFLFLQTTAADKGSQILTRVETYHDYSLRLNGRHEKIGFEWQIIFCLSELTATGKA